MNIWTTKTLLDENITSLGRCPANNISTHTPRMYRYDPTGEVFLVKQAPLHSMRAELIGQRVFELAGLPCPKMGMTRLKGELALVVEYLEGYKDSRGNSMPRGFEHNPTMQDGFFLDLLTYNYDRTPWNMMYRDSEFIFIDFGASVLSRARGGTKGFPLTVTPDQVEAVWKRNPDFPETPVNRAYAALVEGPEQYRTAEALALLAKITDADLDRIVDEVYGISGDTEWTQEPSSYRESPKYASHSATVREIIRGGGSEQEYVRRALKSRRLSILAAADSQAA